MPESHFIKLQTKVWNFFKNETLAQVLSREFSKTFKDSYFFNTPSVHIYTESHPN